LREAGLNKEITLVGVQDHLELWNRPEWDVHYKELRARGAEIALRVKQDELQQRTLHVSPELVGDAPTGSGSPKNV
jgi:DNA-binding transcriptional regulator/RsmH inhibitor MraZ